MPATTVASTSIDFVKSLYDAFGRGDIPFILSRLSPDCKWIATGEGLPSAGTYTGPEEIAGFFRKIDEHEVVTRFEPLQFFTDGDDVAVHGYEEVRVKSNGATVGSNWMMLFRVRDGLLTHWEGFNDSAAYARAHRLE